MAGRMVGCSPFIPYELGKYLSFFLFMWGISMLNFSNKLGYFVILLTLPGIILGWPKAPDYRYIIFNVMGIVNFGLGIAFFGGLRLKKFKIDIYKSILFMIYPLVISLIYAFLETPSYDNMEFELGANFEASGGFGSNQVSTAFGLGLFLVFFLWFQNFLVTGFSRLLDIGLAALFLFQGLLTFSRGGIIGGGIAILILLFYQNKSRLQKALALKIRVRLFFFGLPILILVMTVANNLTDGNLLLRYQGETTGTLLGVKEKSLNSISTGRFNIFLGDLEIFSKHPILGVGVNESRNYRNYHQGVVAHVELSRLLSEHGILGVLIFSVFLWSLFAGLSKNSINPIYFLFAVIGLYTTFHAATRTFLSPLFMALAFLPTKTIMFDKVRINK